MGKIGEINALPGILKGLLNIFLFVNKHREKNKSFLQTFP